jgi:FkbM family methyltransferase
MTFISYAQNFEDVMLWRALKHVQAGFYIDVGAGHPDDYSVTRAFYDRGWRGINIEPTSRITRLAGARPLDLNLHAAAVGQATDKLILFVVEDNKDISTLDPALAQTHRATGCTISESTVSAVTLAEICRQHVRCDIHFLKIDVEGAERQVLQGADFAQYRPWVVVVEATAPNSQVSTHAAWDELLTDAEYRFVWFDGLNRFYIAAERWDNLSAAFAAPPNIFDDFIRATDTEHLNRIIGAEVRAANAEARVAALNVDLEKARTSERAAREQLEGATAEAERLRVAMATASTEAERLRTEVAAASTEAERLCAEMAAMTAHNQALIVDSARARAEVAAALRREEDAEARMAELEMDLVRLEADERTLRAWLEAVGTSTSWRVTRPLRGASLLLRRLRG